MSDLETWLAEHGPLEPAYALELVSRICAALAAGGAVHGHVRPGTILVHDGPDGLVPELRDAGAQPGGVAYTAPERHLGGTATEPGDQYAVGCVLWTCLTGAPPYDGTDLQVMNAHITAPVPQLAGETLETEAINGVLATALAKRPEQRFTSLAAMDAAIREVLTTFFADAPPWPYAAAAEAAPEATPEEPEPVQEEAPVFPPATRRPAPAAPFEVGVRRDRSVVRRYWWVGALVLLLLGGGGVAVAVNGHGGSPEAASALPATPSPGNTPSSPSTPSASPTPPPLPVPTVTASPGYERVSFALSGRLGGGRSYQVSIDRGATWKRLSAHTLTTKARDGQRVCALARVADRTGDHGEAARACGTAWKATIGPVHRDDALCSGAIAGYDGWALPLSGFEPRSTQEATIRLDSDRGTGSFPESRPVDADGRGHLSFCMPPGSHGTATVTLGDLRVTRRFG